jgi:hypothetical protein
VTARRRYVKKAEAAVVAVRLDLDTEGFVYQKWGGPQTCKPGDWVVDNGGDVYSVDREVFEATYREQSPGVYVKQSAVWAEVAERAGSIRTKEGVTHYEAGAYLVYNDPEGEDGWAVTAEKFQAMYEPAP